MADLPTIENKIPQVRAPESRVSPGQVASPYLELAHELDSASKEVGGLSERLARTAAATAVTRDENGNMRIDRPPIVGDAALEYGRAVKVQAMAEGENVVKADMLAIRHEHKDDPAAFVKAADAYVKTKVPQYAKAAGPEVAGALRRQAESIGREFHAGLLNQKERLDLARSTAAIEAQIETTKNELFALANGGADGSVPGYTERLQKIGALWGQLSNNPKLAIPKERVAFEMSQLGSELDVAERSFRIGKIQAEKGPDAALAEAEKIRTDPRLNLSPGQRENYYSRIVGGIHQRVNAQNTVDRGTASEIKEIGKVAAEGYTVTPDRIAAARTAVIQSGNPGLTAALLNVETIQPIIADWRKASPAQLERNLSDLDRTMRETGATPAMMTLRDVGQDLLKNMRAGIKTDPLGWADRTGAVPVPALDFSAPDLPAQMRNRAATAETVAAHYGVAPAYLKPDERAAIEAASAQGGKAMTDIAGTIVAGFGDRAQRVLTEISKDSPVLAHVGGLLTTGGSPALIRDAAEAVKLRANPEFKHPRWLAKESDAIQFAQNARTVDVYGNAFVLAPDTGRAAVMTANSAFFTRSMRNNYDPKFVDGDTSASKKAYDRTLQEAAGATFDPKGTQYGGIGSYGTKPGTWFTGNKVLVPGNVRADRFGDVIGAVKDEDIGGKWKAFGGTFGVRDLQNSVPVAVRGGYRFAAGDPNSDDPKWIPDANGKPLVVDLEQLEPVLRKRVPQAYAGQ